MGKIFKHNGLSIVFFVLFLLTLYGQTLTGLKQYNNELKEHADQPVSYVAYLSTGHFFEATFENWESEFLQMAFFVILTMHLYQKGSSESKDPDKKEEVDNEPDPKKEDVPWAVKKGGFILSVYKYSLGYSLFLLFILSFGLHWYGSLLHYNKQQMLKHEPTETALQYIGNSRLWFESFENWQSEFLSVFAIVILSIYLRQKGSSQSKAVDAPNSETGG